MAEQTKIKVPKFNRLFAVKKYKEKRYFRKSTMTDEEILKLREELGITPNDKNKPYRGGTHPKPL